MHGLMVVLDCGQKRQSLAHFRDNQRNNHGCGNATSGQSMIRKSRFSEKIMLKQ